MARKHVQKHAKKLIAHQKKHRIAIYRLMRKVAKEDLKRRQAGAFRAGAGRRKKKLKGPKWCYGPIPKSGWPKKPAGMGKKAGAWWSRHKTKAQKAQAKAKSLLGKLWQKGKDAGKQVLGKASDLLAKHGDQILDAGMKVLSSHIDEASSHADKYLTDKIDHYGNKAVSKIESAGKRKGGMMLMGSGLPKKKRGGMMLMGSGLQKKKRGGMMLMGSGLPKKKRGGKLPSWQEILAPQGRGRLRTGGSDGASIRGGMQGARRLLDNMNFDRRTYK